MLPVQATTISCVQINYVASEEEDCGFNSQPWPLLGLSPDHPAPSLSLTTCQTQGFRKFHSKKVATR